MTDQEQNQQKELTSYEKARQVISDLGVVVCAEELALFERAEDGDIDAMDELFVKYSDRSSSIPYNYKVTQRYLKMIDEWASKTNDPVRVLRVKTNATAMLHQFEEDNPKIIEDAIIEAMSYMVKYVDFQDWNEDFLRYAKEMVAYSQD